MDNDGEIKCDKVKDEDEEIVRKMSEAATPLNLVGFTNAALMSPDCFGGDSAGYTVPMSKDIFDYDSDEDNYEEEFVRDYKELEHDSVDGSMLHSVSEKNLRELNKAFRRKDVKSGDAGRKISCPAPLSLLHSNLKPLTSKEFFGKRHSSPGLKIPNVFKFHSGDKKSATSKEDEPKAMSMPHDTTTSSEQNDKWLHEARKDFFPNRADWTVQACNGSHIWLETEVSGCFATQDCKKTGPRKRCAACKIVAHQKCIQLQVDSIPKCRMTFREATPKCAIEVNPPHHIVYRRKQDGRCDVCGKSFQSMLSYKTQKENIALNCSWCKRGFHTKDCSKQFLKEKHCDLGIHKNVILPPSWIVKLPPRKYSTVASKRGRPSTRRHSSRERRAFVVKSIVSDLNKVPLIIFVNPRSGGNQGVRILEKYQYLLNPRQVFDLSCGGPRFGLDLFRKVSNLRILVCGGDGSVGWVLSEIDRLKMNPPPSVSILPLGTGNDLARFLGWGGGYADEPLSKIVSHVEDGEIQKLDRWDIDVRGNTSLLPESEPNDENAVSRLPLNVMNNYFSMGADADVCLEFHESREANPEKFNSRIKNKYFYGKIGGEKLIKRQNKDLHKSIESFVCDGVDITDKIKELKPVALVFLNISTYSSGTTPWGNRHSENFLPQSCDDGYLEVIGLTSTSMVTSQIGGHGIRIFQCQSALLYTNTKISMQVDGEPCRLNPARIHITKKRNQASMIVKKKSRKSLYHQKTIESDDSIMPSTICTKLYYLNFAQYDSLVKYDIDEIKNIVQEIGSIQVELDMQLDDMRKILEKLKSSGELSLRLTDEWCFLDATWTARIYRIDDAQECLLHVCDIMEAGIYVLDLKKGPELTAPMNNISSKSQPNSPQLERGFTENYTPIVEERTPPRTLHSLSLDFSSVPTLYKEDDEDDDIDSFSDSDLTEDSDNEEMNSLSSSPGMSSPPQTPLTPSADTEFIIPSDDESKARGLMDAAKRGLVNKFQAIHESGCSLSARDSTGGTPLHIACKYGRKEIVNYIVDKITPLVINMTEKENGHTPLHVAALYKRRTICRILISRGASVTRFDLEGYSPRLLALSADDTELAKYLQNQERLQLIAADDHETAV